MAQGGMGDVLTGCIASFLTQGLTPLDAAIVGCYMHGLAGDELSETNQITPPTSLIQQIPQTLKHIYIHKKRKSLDFL
jgi:Predicted sugar kinase